MSFGISLPISHRSVCQTAAAHVKRYATISPLLLYLSSMGTSYFKSGCSPGLLFNHDSALLAKCLGLCTPTILILTSLKSSHPGIYLSFVLICSTSCYLEVSLRQEILTSSFGKDRLHMEPFKEHPQGRAAATFESYGSLILGWGLAFLVWDRSSY